MKGLLATSAVVAVSSDAFNHVVDVIRGNRRVVSSYKELRAISGMNHYDEVTVSSGTGIDGTFIYVPTQNIGNVGAWEKRQ